MFDCVKTKGSPATEHRFHHAEIGIVVEVIDGDTLKVAIEDRTFITHLVGIDAPALDDRLGGYARDILQREAPVGSPVVVYAYRHSSYPDQLFAVVEAGLTQRGQLGDVRVAMLAYGGARHVDSQYDYVAAGGCLNVLQNNAVLHNLGLWAEGAVPRTVPKLKLKLFADYVKEHEPKIYADQL